MSDRLNILVLESEVGAADEARRELEDAGHRVVACHEPGADAFPCAGLRDGRHCPLDGTVVDVALDVRPRPRSQPAPREDGVACVLRHHVPLVIAGPPGRNPFKQYAQATIPRTHGIVETCERTAHATLSAHTNAAARALREVLDRRHVNSSPLVAVRRRDGALLVEVKGADAIDRETRSMAAVRMVGAVRALDHDARGCDVVFH
jgi:hypothetical protein